MGNICCIDFLQLALEPLWKLYEVCNQGTDVKAVMSKAVKSLSLTQVRLYPLCTDYISFTQQKNTFVTLHFTHGLTYVGPCITLHEQYSSHTQVSIMQFTATISEHVFKYMLHTVACDQHCVLSESCLP